MNRKFELAVELMALMVIVDSEISPEEEDMAREVFLAVEPEGLSLANADDTSVGDVLRYLHQKHCG